MNPATRIAAALTLTLTFSAALPATGQDRSGPPAAALVLRLADRSLRNADYTAVATRRADSAPAAEPAPAPAPEPASDPYGFAAILNNYRASAGLPPIAYDTDLAGWAASNNAAQSRYGLGHHVNPGCAQNSGWNYSDAWSCAVGWMNSPAHRNTLLAPGASRFGIAYGPGPYWTLNVR